MKRFPPAVRRRWALAFSCGVVFCVGDLGAAEPSGARLTRVIKDVKVFSSQNPARSARPNDQVFAGGAVRTGVAARTELTFTDRTVVRLGANTFCNLAGDSRSLQLNEGAVLFQAPDAASGGVKIKTGGITASIRGTTGIMERHESYYVKILILQGTARVYLSKLGESVLVRAGQMLITKPGTKTLPEAVHFDVAQLYKTSLLTNADFAPLASRDEIVREMQKQQSDPNYIRTNLVIHGRGTLVNLMPAAPAAPTSGKPKPTPRPDAPARR